MKTYLLIFSFLVFTFTAMAQAPSAHSTEKQAARLSQMLANNLELNEHGYIRVKALTVAYLTERQKILTDYSYDPELQKTRLAEAEDIYQRRMQLSLRAKQLDNYIAGRTRSHPAYISLLTE
ncbi:MAG TPA: hypothetical protein VK927_05555 [Adhaeribacter sp.]|nr:hypothetical protein [Adhaeribacter sp.]